MLQRIIEQKIARTIYSSNSKNNLDILNANHWKLMENIIRLLQPFEELTKRASDDDVDLSFVIPAVNALQKYLAKTWKDSGVKTMKDELLNSVTERFGTIKEKKLYVLATVLNPQYKLAPFDIIDQNKTKFMLKEEVKLL